MDEVVAEAEAALAACPGMALAQKIKGDGMLLKGRRAEAIAAYEAAQASVEGVVYGPALYNLGLARSLEGDYRGAAQVFGDLLAHDAGYEGVHRARARAWLALGEDEAALKDAQEAVRRDAEDGEARFVLGEALDRRGEVEAARASYCEARARGVARAAAMCPDP